MKGEVIIPLSKLKIKWMIVGSISLILLSILLFETADTFMSTDFSKTVSEVAGIAGILFFSLALFYAFKKLKSNDPGLIITKLGFIDNSSGISAGLVEWRDVTGFKEFTTENTKNLVVLVSNPDEYIQRADSFVAKKMMQANNKIFKSPVAIAAVSLTINYEELKALIINGYENYINK